MQPSLPFFVIPVFFLAVGLMGWFLYLASRSRFVSAGLLLWGVSLLAVATTGFFQDTTALPPRLLLAILPTLGLVGFGVFSRPGNAFIQSFDLGWLTALSVVRVPVELVLLWLYRAGQVPQVMTFEGWNFDILAGLMAPLVAWFGFWQPRLPRWVVLGWHVAGLGLLLTIVMLAVLSLPGPLQQLAFEQPNRAVLTAPFVLLPALIVPVVLYSHLVSIRRLLSQ